VLVDHVTAGVMGLPAERIPQIARALEAGLLGAPEVASIEQVLDGPEPALAFRPPRSWPSLLPAESRAAS
jgi:hypothetical protein